MIAATPRQKQRYTPLRYPGGKASLSSFLQKTIEFNRLKNVTYIEPYAGGAGAALILLLTEKVDRIVINDFDRAIFAFWKSILDYPDEFIARLEATPIDIAEWRTHKATYKAKESADLFDLGFATFFLNRTNRSGILTGGPIGGLAQSGAWRLDARFNKLGLTEKIRQIASHKGQIDVLNEDGLDTIKRYANNPRNLIYADPPYYDKGSSLYYNSYRHDDHARLAGLLNSTGDGQHWILSYDNVEPIRQLYAERQRQKEFFLHYQAHSSRKGSELLVMSDTLAFPPMPIEVK